MLEASLDPFLLDSNEDYAHCAAGKEISEPAGEDMVAIREMTPRPGRLGEGHRER